MATLSTTTTRYRLMEEVPPGSWVDFNDNDPSDLIGSPCFVMFQQPDTNNPCHFTVLMNQRLQVLQWNRRPEMPLGSISDSCPGSFEEVPSFQRACFNIPLTGRVVILETSAKIPKSQAVIKEAVRRREFHLKFFSNNPVIVAHCFDLSGRVSRV